MGAAEAASKSSFQIVKGTLRYRTANKAVARNGHSSADLSSANRPPRTAGLTV